MTPILPTMPQAVTIRAATREDAPALIELIIALAHFEHLTPPDAAAQQRLIEHGFGPRPRYEAWLAWWHDTPQPVGYAFGFETYSSFEARPTWYLEDLFVLPEFRGHGIGLALLNHCIRLARKRDCGRMEWIVLDWNHKAQRFYESLGARRLSEWYLYRLSRDTLDRLPS